MTERMGLGWLFWVLGWALLVGGVLFVVPAFLLFGTSAAVVVGGILLLLSLGLTWLAASAAHVVNEATELEDESALRESAVSKS